MDISREISSRKAEFRNEKNAQTQVSVLSNTGTEQQISAFLLLIVESINNAKSFIWGYALHQFAQ